MNIKEKTFLISGGTSGVGYATAQGLARLGAKFVIVSRTAERGQQALKTIAETTGNDHGDYLVADLSLQASIRQAAAEFKRKYDNLHVLANLGGAAFFDRDETAEGLERTLAVNYLSHFLLTTELLDMLKASAPSRVITVAGLPAFLKKPKIDLDDLQSEKRFSGVSAMSQAMFARIYFALELARRLEGTGVTSIPFHCGSVKSNLGRNEPNIPWWLKLLAPYFERTSVDTCDIAVHLATSPEVEGISGVFYDDKKRVLPLTEGFAKEVATKLWGRSEQLVHRG